MKLTRDERQSLEKATIKERVERLEEYVDYLQERKSQRDLDEFNKEMDEINDTYDKHCMWAVCMSMILVWIVIWGLIFKLCI